MTSQEDLARLISAVCPDAFYVGGCVRDALLGRPSGDLDLALEKNLVRARARELAARLEGTAFVIDEENIVVRVTGKNPACQLDLSALQGTLPQDLARRDFTVNALAYPVNAPCRITPSETEPGKLHLSGLTEQFLIDPRGGKTDLEKKRLRALEPAFTQDPLRLLRAYRIAGELNLAISPATLRHIRRHHALIASVSGERVRDELVRLLALPGVRARLYALDRAGLLCAIFPLLEQQKGCAPQYYGGLGVFSHTLAVCDRLEFLLAHLEQVFPEFHQELAPHARRSGFLQLVALLHDISKPETAKEINNRLRFFNHEGRGAKRAEAIMRELRFSRAEITLASKIVGEHLRPGNLAANRLITPRAMYRFFSELGEAAVPMTLVCWADYASYIPLKTTVRLLPKTRETPVPVTTAELPAKGVRKTLRHMQVLHLMLNTFFNHPKTVRPDRLVSGTDLMAALGIAAGPAIGRLLEEIRMAQAEGRVATPEQALALARRLHEKRSA